MPIEFLKGYQGYVQTDGFCGYDELGKQTGICLVGCWAHARRKFIEVLRVTEKASRKKTTTHTNTALGYIRRLYEIEKKAKEKKLSALQIYDLRQEKAKPLLEEFKKWLTALFPQTPPKGLLGKAIAYTLNQWSKLVRYIEDGGLSPAII